MLVCFLQNGYELSAPALAFRPCSSCKGRGGICTRQGLVRCGVRGYRTTLALRDFASVTRLLVLWSLCGTLQSLKLHVCAFLFSNTYMLCMYAGMYANIHTGTRTYICTYRCHTHTHAHTCCGSVLRCSYCLTLEHSAHTSSFASLRPFFRRPVAKEARSRIGRPSVPRPGTLQTAKRSSVSMRGGRGNQIILYGL